MKRMIIVCLAVAAALGGCSDSRSVMEGYDARYETQMKKYDEQTARADAQLDQADEQAKRFETLLKRWEGQADRYDLLLMKWEAQADAKAR